MHRIKDSRFISRSVIDSGAVLTYEKGILVCRGKQVFPLGVDVAKFLYYYFENLDQDFIRVFDVLRGLVITPDEVSRRWGCSSPLCHFCFAPMEDDKWILVYSSSDNGGDDSPMAMIVGQDFLEVILADCGSYMICTDDTRLDMSKLWTFQAQMPDSGAVLCVTTSGLDLLLAQDRAFSTTGADVFYWMTFNAFCREMLEWRKPGSIRLGVPFGKAGYYDLILGDDGLMVNLYQEYEGGPELVGRIPMTLDGIEIIGLAISRFRVGIDKVSMDLPEEDAPYIRGEDDEGEGAAS